MNRMIATLCGLLLAQAAAAQSSSGVVTIDSIRTGWNSDTFAIETVQPIVNPASCPAPDGYSADSTVPGYQTYLSASLTAFSLDYPIVVTVDSTRCVSQRPRILGVNILR